MKPQNLNDITLPVSLRFPHLVELFIGSGLNPDEVYVWHRAAGGHGEAILVINGCGFEAEAEGQIGDGSRLAVEAALRNYVASIPV